jgi:N-acetylmuramoyl-L-alanine amidase
MPPRIVTARSIGLQFVASKLGTMGPEKSVVGHYSGGARAKNMAEGIARARSFHRDHQVNRGWAGIGYHYLISDDGVIICCRSTFHTGAHVLMNNSGRIGVNMPGTLTATIKDRPTRRQARTFNWLLHNAHTDAMPRAHRTDVNLSTLPRFGHNDLMATSCPGLFKGMFKKGGEPWVEPSGDEQPDDGLAELTPEDEEVVAEVDRGNVPDHEADKKAFGPDEEEKDAPAGELVLPERDDEFDEDLSDVADETETEPARG